MNSLPETKPFWKSKTLWGSALSLLATILAAIGQHELAAAVVAIGTALTGVGRVSATKGLRATRNPRPTTRPFQSRLRTKTRPGRPQA